jgi:hypothetical protein
MTIRTHELDILQRVVGPVSVAMMDLQRDGEAQPPLATAYLATMRLEAFLE